MAVIWRWSLKKEEKMNNLSVDHWVRIKDGKIIVDGEVVFRPVLLVYDPPLFSPATTE